MTHTSEKYQRAFQEIQAGNKTYIQLQKEFGISSDTISDFRKMSQEQFNKYIDAKKRREGGHIEAGFVKLENEERVASGLLPTHNNGKEGDVHPRDQILHKNETITCPMNDWEVLKYDIPNIDKPFCTLKQFLYHIYNVNTNNLKFKVKKLNEIIDDRRKCLNINGIQTDREVHCFLDKFLFGKEYPEVHFYLDRPHQTLFGKHRLMFHDEESALVLACRYNDIIVYFSARCHILLDKHQGNTSKMFLDQEFIDLCYWFNPKLHDVLKLQKLIKEKELQTYVNVLNDTPLIKFDYFYKLRCLISYAENRDVENYNELKTTIEDFIKQEPTFQTETILGDMFIDKKNYTCSDLMNDVLRATEIMVEKNVNYHNAIDLILNQSNTTQIKSVQSNSFQLK